jgi:site-specific DNA recombinase
MVRWRNGRARVLTDAPTRIRAAVYTRKSTTTGLDSDFTTLDNQRDRGESLVASQDWEVVRTRYDDGGFSGGNTDRPALQQLLRDVEAGLVDAIIVYRLDRITRSLADFVEIHKFLESHDVALVSVTESINTQTPHGRMMINVLLSFAQYERELAGERTRHKIHAARQRGRWTGGNPVLGYDTAPDRSGLVVNKDEAEQVRSIFAMYVENPSLTAVAEELNRRGWTTKSWVAKTGKQCGGHPWTKVTLRRLLTDPLNIGLQKLGDETFPGEHQAIVPRKLFDQVQHLLHENRSNGGAAHRNRHGALLRGILRCAACNAPMTFAPTKKGGRVYRYYRCSAAMKRGRSVCATGSLKADKIEALVVDQIRRVGADPELQAETFRQVLAEVAAKRRGLKAEAKRLAKQITATEKTVAKLVHTLADAKGDARSAVNAELEKSQEQHRFLEARLAEVRAQEADLAAQDIDEADVASALEEFDAIWEVLLTPERERVLQLLIEQVSYDRETEELKIELSAAGIATVQKELDWEATQ